MAKLSKLLKRPETIIGAALLGPLGAAAGGFAANTQMKAEQAAVDQAKLGEQQIAQAEQQKQQAIVDAQFSDVAKKKKNMLGRQGSNSLYNLGSTQSGLYTI